MTVGRITRERLEVLLAAYGADPARWPSEEREAALALLAVDTGAQALRDAAARLDAVLALDRVGALTPGLADRILADAPGAAGGARPHRAVRAARRSPQPVGHRRRFRYLAAAVAVPATAAVTLWLTSVPDARQPVAAESPASMPIAELSLAELGSYETPADALLAVSDVGLYDGDPWIACPDAMLGCIDVDAMTDDRQSQSTSEERVRA